MEVPQNIKNRTTVGSSNSTSGYISKENKNTNLERQMHLYVAALFTIAKMWKQSKCPLSCEWIKKIWCVCLYCGLLAIKKNEILSLVTTGMDLDSILLSEISQTNKDKYYMISLACGS